MQFLRSLRYRAVFGLVLTIGTLSGCQTYFGGMTLPSGYYLKHYPQYFEPDPPFPLQRELDSQIDPDGQLRGRNVDGAIPGVPPAGVNQPAPLGGN